MDSKDKYFLVFQALFDLILMVQEDGIIIDCNKMVEQTLGYTSREIIGQNLSKIIHPDYMDKSREHLNKLVKNIRVEKEECQMVKKDGSIIYIIAKCNSLRDENGKFIHTVCLISDISERKKDDKKLKAIAQELQRSNEELEQFAYVASHDLQEPIRTIHNYCKLLLEDNLEIVNKKSEKHLKYIIEGSSRMRNLIKDLLDFSKIGKDDIPFEEIDLNEVIKEVKQDFVIYIKENNAEIICDYLPVIFAEKSRIRQLFHNLISNSIKFRGNISPYIHIGYENYGEYFKFFIKDNGIGIKEKYYNEVFGVFKRLYSRNKYPGTGIGLAICRKIVENYGGKIWTEPNMNKGSVFYFTFLKKN